MFIPPVPALIVGKTYFCCTYFLEKLPVPDIETWIYLGADIYDEEQREKIGYHYFKKPEVYYSDQIAKENERLVEANFEEENDISHQTQRMRISEKEVEGMIYDYITFRSWVNQLEQESNADKVL